MKTFRFFALVGIFSLFLVVQPTVAFRMEQTHFDEFQNYVVIGAFRYQRNAVRFTRHAHNDLNLDARLEMNLNRNLYYVYVLRTNDRAAAISEALRLRSESELSDTWVYSGPFKGEVSIPGEPTVRGVDINPATQKSIDHVASPDSAAPKGTNGNGVAQTTSTTPDNTTTTTPAGTTANQPKPESNTPAASKLDDGVEGKRFLFRLYRAMDNDTVQGDVDVIDVERTRKVGSYKGNVPVKVADPASKTDDVSLVCEVFGYRKVQRDINYNTPEGEGIEQSSEGATLVPFELVRLQKGDIAVMYNVYFFKDAAIMRPESRYEVTSLLEMLNENTKYKIRIHGHTNGGASGKIISKSKDSNNFFSLSGDTHEGFGTAKKLSEERAIVIRDYLVSNGVDAARMEVKAWGGKRPLQDKNSSRAQENVRVEIEILEN
jgi:outer membrane protein OmpA-like peptidoglycan-associated protein